MSQAPADRRHREGPFRADALGPDDDYELSNGHAIYCAPTGARGGRATVLAAQVIASDPAVEEAGIDVGYSPDLKNVRAPDLSIGNVPNKPGWAPKAPFLAVEYADTGQDESELELKIEELLARGTRHIWVVRLIGPRRVEIYEPGQAPRVVGTGGVLHAPGILAHPVEVDALFDRRAALDVMLRNALARAGYGSLDDVREEGREEGREDGQLLGFRRALHALLSARGIELDAGSASRIDTANEDELLQWIARAASASDAGQVFG